MRASRYDSVAAFYEAGWPDRYDDPVSEALLDLAGDVDRLRVLDLACGHGRISRELARRGAEVVGIDLSEALITRARTTESAASLGVTYVVGDASRSTDVPSGPFDVVVCSFGLSDIDDLDGVAMAVSQALMPSGTFVASLLHPCFPGGTGVSGSWPTSGTYYDEGWWIAEGALSSLRHQVGANHRMLSTYLNTLRRHGLVLNALREPEPVADPDGQRADSQRFPYYLVASWVLVGSA